MPDPYSHIATTETSFQEQLAEILELRATDARQQEMLQEYLSELDPPAGGKVIEIGCGTGAVTRALASVLNTCTVTGVDPSPVFIQKANELSDAYANLEFVVGDGRQLDFEAQSFDLAVFHTTLCHIPKPETAIQEANRILKPGGTLVIFDGDYVTGTVAIEEFDPLQIAVDKMIHNYVENKWFCRQLPKVLHTNGFETKRFRSHGYTGTRDSVYMQTILARGADLLALTGTVSAAHAEAIKNEARRRMEQDEFFSHISYVSAIAVKV
ncbi:MAG: methyltransferase domain-containing protein [Bacteroidetes bacterium]|nr:MAG: methyltransferase domain-containing protein [Bacteroidota bacterium]